MNRNLVKSHKAGAAITKFRIVKYGANDGEVLQGAAVGDFLMGVADELDAASGARIDIIRDGIAAVEYGGSITRGNPLTSDASGKALAAAPAGGTNNRIIGFAEVSGSSGDIGEVHISPGYIQG